MRTTQEEIVECEALRCIIEAQPEALSVLQRAIVCSAYRSRWPAYSALKDRCRDSVGWQAPEEVPCDAGAYEAVIAALEAGLETVLERDAHGPGRYDDLYDDVGVW